MLTKLFSASLAALLAVGVFAADAQADERKRLRKHPSHDRYYAGPDFVKRAPGLRLFFGDYALTRQEFDAIYGDDDDFDDFDESYYEPEAVTPRPAKKKTAPVQATKPAAAKDGVTTASVSKPEKTTAVPKAKPVTTSAATTSKATATGSTAAGGMSCDKAGSIISGYGFQSVKASSCAGKVYAFNATRDGKSFAIKLDAASGELTEVKKLQ